MGSFSDYAENKILDHVFGGPDFTRPATLYAALSTATITDTTTGTTITEPSGNNYSRVSITNNNTNFPAASGGAKANGTAITFPQASGSWGTITDGALIDAATLGNIIGYGALTASKTIDNGDTLTIPVGDLDITLS